MKKDSAVKLKLSPEYASIANYWKFYDGETKQLLKYDVYGQKKKAEEKFMAWAKGQPEYQNIFTEWNKAYDAWRKYAKHRMYINEGVFGSPLMMFAASLKQVEAALVKPGSTKAEIQKAIEAAVKARTSFLKEEDRTSDQNIVAAVTMLYYKDVPKEQHPVGFYGTLKDRYGSLEDEPTYKKYAADIFKTTHDI